MESPIRFMLYNNPYSAKEGGKEEAVHTSMDDYYQDYARPIKKTRKVKGSRPDCAVGVQLIHFMVERDLLNLSTDVGVTEEGPVVLKKGRAYIIRHCYVICNFSLSHLPLKLNLPKVCRPIDGHPAESGSVPDMLSDLVGGYLCKPSGHIYNKFRLLTSHDLNHFFLK